MSIIIKELADNNGKSRFQEWAATLDDRAFLRIQKDLQKLEQGNFSNVKWLGGGVHELRIHFGPGYRVYFGRVGQTVILLLGAARKSDNRVI